MDRILEVKDLRTSFFTTHGEIKAVNGVSYHIDQGEVVALVGESGSGKSVTQMSVLQLIQSPPGKILGGEVLFQGRDLLKYRPDSKEMEAIRGAEIAMVFQEPMTSLNPVFTIGTQLTDVIRKHKKVSKKKAWELGIQALENVSIPDAPARMKNYPFELSGGMRQRVIIATAVACGSKLIIADEPTTALDVTIQAQVMELLMGLVKKQNVSILVVTHNLGLVTRYADRIYVMYAGRIVESGTTEELIKHPQHPYTISLLHSVPQLDDNTKESLFTIEGAPTDLSALPDRCAFYPRCPYACPACEAQPVPQLKQVSGNAHYAACHRDMEKVIYAQSNE